MSEVWYCYGCACWSHSARCGQCGGPAVPPSQVAAETCCPDAIRGTHTPGCRLDHAVAALTAAVAQILAILDEGEISRTGRLHHADALRASWSVLGDLVGEACRRWHPGARETDLPAYLGRASEAVNRLRHDVMEAWDFTRDQNQVSHDINRHLYQAEQALRQQAEGK